MVLFAGGLGSLACSSIDIAEPGPLSVSFTASPATAVAGTPIDFRFEASGNQLASIALVYGDGAVDSVDTLLARTAQGSRRHTYTSAGDYQARITVYDPSMGRAADTVLVRITANAPARTGSAAKILRAVGRN
jgi:hypothetical protein